MKRISNKMSYKEVFFLIKQEVVYLEKEIIAARNEGKEFYIVFINDKAWNVQTNADTFSSSIISQMNQACEELKKNYEGHDGNLSVRYFDTNILSLLFVGCKEKEVIEYCKKVQSKYMCWYSGNFDFEYIGDDLYKISYQINNNPNREKKRKVEVGLSYQQNYLAHVVSRDRNEPLEILLSEAVNQVVFKYHQVVRNE